MVASRRISLSFALLTAIIIACGDGKSVPSVNPTSVPTSTAARAKPPDSATFSASITCAAGSTARFLAVERQASFAVYCPTYLPDGFRLDRATFVSSKPGATPEQVEAVYVNDQQGRITFSQGVSGNDLFPEWRLYTQPPSEPVHYGDIAATLYHEYTFPDGTYESAVVWANAPGSKLHLIVANSPMVDTATMRRIAEGMVRLAQFGTPTP